MENALRRIAKGNKGGKSWTTTLCICTSSLEESDKSITLSRTGSDLTLITGGVLKASVEDRRGA